MHNVEVKYYHQSDCRLIKFNDKDEYQNIITKVPDYFIILPQACEGNVYSIWKEGKVIAITGWVGTLMSHAEIFFFASEELHEHFDKDVLKAFRTVLNSAKAQWKRLQTTCKDIDVNKRFLEFLGFKQECLMKKYGFNSEDMYLYAWTECQCCG